MNNLWYKNLGFKENPLTIKPGALTDEIVAYDLEEIYDNVEAGNVQFIEGPYGMGKSTILKNIINEFGNDKRIVYYSANRSGAKVNFSKILNEKRSLMGKMLNMRPKEIVLLVDESEYLAAEDFDELKVLYEKNVLKSIVFVGSIFDELKINDYFTDLVKDDIITLVELDEAEAVSLIRSRIGSIEFISDDVIKMVYEKSEKNPRILLKNTEEVCRHAYELGDDLVNEEHINDIFAEN